MANGISGSGGGMSGGISSSPAPKPVRRPLRIQPYFGPPRPVNGDPGGMLNTPLPLMAPGQAPLTGIPGGVGPGVPRPPDVIGRPVPSQPGLNQPILGPAEPPGTGQVPLPPIPGIRPPPTLPAAPGLPPLGPILGGPTYGGPTYGGGNGVSSWPGQRQPNAGYTFPGQRGGPVSPDQRRNAMARLLTGR